MRRETLLTLKRYPDGPESYKINKSFKEENKPYEGFKIQSQIKDEGTQTFSTSEEDAESDLESEDYKTSVDDNELESKEWETDDQHSSHDSFTSFWMVSARRKRFRPNAVRSVPPY